MVVVASWLVSVGGPWRGIPDEVSEVVLLEVAHFERQRIHVRGGPLPRGEMLQRHHPK